MGRHRVLVLFTYFSFLDLAPRGLLYYGTRFFSGFVDNFPFRDFWTKWRRGRKQGTAKDEISGGGTKGRKRRVDEMRSDAGGRNNVLGGTKGRGVVMWSIAPLSSRSLSLCHVQLCATPIFSSLQKTFSKNNFSSMHWPGYQMWEKPERSKSDECCSLWYCRGEEVEDRSKGNKILLVVSNKSSLPQPQSQDYSPER